MSAGIPWRPIAELPDALKDGREVLLWEDETNPHFRGRPVIGIWGPSHDREYLTGWVSTNTGTSYTPTHFAEINLPA